MRPPRRPPWTPGDTRALADGIELLEHRLANALSSCRRPRLPRALRRLRRPR